MVDFFQHGDVRLAFERTGSGPALVLMHGAEANRAMFAALAPLLAGHFTVIACDQRDCGDTDGPERAATLADLADDAHALIVGLGFDRASVFGSSFGGRVAQALALRHPHVVDRLVLGSTWPLPHALSALNPEGVARMTDLRERLPRSAQALAGLFFPESFLRERPDLRQVFAAVRPASDRSRRRAQTVNASLDADAASIEAPTLLIAGELDEVVPAAVTLGMAALLRGSRQAVLQGVGHATALQAPQALAAEIVRFLNSPRGMS